MSSIKFGTDGWRAIIARDFTVDNLIRVTEATCEWLLKKQTHPTVVIGYDTRFGGELFAETSAKVFLSYNIKVFLSKGFASTPMVSFGTTQKKSSLGVVITASHNPPSYNGYKLKGPYGGPLLPEYIEEIEKLIQEKSQTDTDKLNLNSFLDKGLLEYIDLEDMYVQHVKRNFNIDLIQKSGLNIAYDAMYGAGQNVIRKLFPDATLLHCDHNPSFKGQAPEPIHKNLTELSSFIKRSRNIDFGFATDGDADRIGLYDKEGNFIDSHHVILLLIKYLAGTKGLTGKVVTAFSVSPKVGKMCRHFSLHHVVTKIGFKYIASHMITEDVLLGGEESGGIAIKGHVPERDGIWIGLTLLEYMAKTQKSLKQLIEEVYQIVGPFAFERSDLHLQETIKNEIISNCEKNIYESFGEYKIQRTETIDGYKYFFNEDDWFMIRPSGTEPVLRNYAQSHSQERAFSILKAAEQTLLKRNA
jgi:phosphomannomutase